MYHVMIVDDELYARMRIKVEFELKKEGFLVDQEAVSGYEALNKMAESLPDIVLTDMRMPGMSGVALIEEIKKRHPGIPVVALSGYSDYEYVRSSLKMGAIDYLLKHELDRETVLHALRKCAEVIQAIHVSGRDEEKCGKSDQNNRMEGHGERRQFLLRLLHGGYADPSGDAEAYSFFQGKKGNIQLILMQLDHVKKVQKENGEIEFLMMIPIILSFLQEVVSQYTAGMVESMGEGEFVILTSFEGVYSQQYISNTRHKLIQSLRANLKKYTNLTASFAVGRIVRRLSELAECYRQTRQELSLSYLTGSNSLINVSEKKETREDELFTLRGEDEKKISEVVRNRDRKQCEEVLFCVFEDLLHREANKASCQVVCMELLNLIIRSTKELPLAGKLLELCTRRKRDVLINETIQDNRQQILAAYEQLFDFLEQMSPLFAYNRNTITAIEYIHSHFQQDISLDEVAGKLNINKSYLSRVFSQDYGKSFTEYVSWYRVEQAKKLLDQGLSIKEVAECVGIRSQSYFFRVFKSCTGVTPNSYLRMS